MLQVKKVLHITQNANYVNAHGLKWLMITILKDPDVIPWIPSFKRKKCPPGQGRGELARSTPSKTRRSKVFNIGDKAVYPVHGVGVIESIEIMEVSGKKQSFYILRILDNEMKIMIPEDNVNHVGMREVVNRREVTKVYEILRRRDIVVDNQTWNRRQREYTDKIKSGSIYEIAEVFRDLNNLKNDKDLSFGERRMMDTAQNLLVKEISVAKDVSENKVKEEFRKIFEH